MTLKRSHKTRLPSPLPRPSPNPKGTALRDKLRKLFNGAERIAVLGVGSELRADDAAGVLIAQNLCKARPKNKKVKFQVIIGGTAPENLSGEIKRFSPTHLVIIDAADMDKKPGTIALLNPQEAAGISFSTHQLPLKIMIDYLLQSISCRIAVIGIQPKTLAFGAACSPEVALSVKKITEIFEGILKS